ncbi:MAG TPA: IPT/TIG domain-containing protein [Streptosporangiaceae bacterium]|nr:IPT/TIG domain-containing protein [Streptosporangiaceae bacterium]
MRNRFGLIMVLTVAASAGAQAAALPVEAGQRPVRSVALPASAAPRLPAGATRIAAVPAAQKIRLEVSLKVRDQAGLNALLAGVTNRHSPYYHHFLSKGQFGPRFGPTLAQVASVDAALKAAGLTPGPVTADRLMIPVTATAAQVERAFGISLVNYRMPGGRIAFANTSAPKIDASVAPLLNGVEGLDDLYQLTPATLHRPSPLDPAHLVRPPGIQRPARPAIGTAGPHPCDAATQSWSKTMDVWAGYYGMTPLYALGDLGQGQRVALLELEPNLPSDISAFESCYGISTQVNYIPVDGGVAPGAGNGEAALDIAIVAGLAPQATIDVYQAPNHMTDLGDIFRRFVLDDTDSTMSVSWGLCQTLTPSADLEDEAGLAGEAAVQGQTILSASGDTGSTSCGDATSLQAPSLSPYLDAVGGTEISGGTEQVWNDRDGSGGGGITAFWCMPNYQYQPAIPGLLDKLSIAKLPTCVFDANLQGFVRPSPDISALSSASYGIFHDGRWQGGWFGTSAAAPLWAAIAALTNASPYCAAYGSGNPGVLPMALYGMVAANQSAIYGNPAMPEVLRDITVGNNDFLPSGYTGGFAPAGPGYDFASGLGAPMVSGIQTDGKFSSYIPGYTALMCQTMATVPTADAVTGVSPSSGTGGPVTISGSGFLPIPRSERVQVTAGSTVLATLVPSCTATACTVTLPAEPAGTVDLQVSVENGAYTAASAADQYTYDQPASPHVSAISPTYGTWHGGTKVTIKGSNFVGVKSVTFGGKAGTHLKVSGVDTLSVTAPKGTEGKYMKVVIKAAGGTSNWARYMYADAPHIASISPAKGTHKGGTKVTIKGSNFAGVKSVTFGGKAGTHLSVSDTGTLTVIVPKGTKDAKVKVIIKAVGGASNSVRYLYN